MRKRASKDVKNFLYRIFCGFFLGISIFAPGVSGSVMAVMMGIYDRLLDIVASPLKNVKRNIIYLFPMGIGAVVSFILFIIGFTYLFDAYEKTTYFLFMGLIAGNIPLIFKDASRDGFKRHYLAGTLVAFCIALSIGIIRSQIPETAAGLSDVSVNLPYLGLSSLVAGISSMVPGMSISMILMVFDVYEQILFSVKAFDVLTIAVVGSCFLAGMISFSRITRFFLRRYHNFVYFMVGGFMCGSLISIYLMPKSNDNFHWTAGIVALIAGLGLSLLFAFLSKKFNTDDLAEPNAKEEQAKAQNE